MFNDFIRAGALRRFVVGGIILVLIVLSGVDAGKADIMKENGLSDCILASKICSEGEYIESPLGFLKSSSPQIQITTRVSRSTSSVQKQDISNGQICGTDGRTYISECQLSRARCEGHPVGVKHKGVCKGQEKRCWDERRLSLKAAANRISAGSGGSGQTFIPECTDDGKFAEIQCHRGTGYCWCVTKDGRPIPGSSTINKRPNCSKKGKSVTNRRSPTNKQKTRKGCSAVDKTVFNSNLVKIFTTEYNRAPRNKTAIKEGTSSETEVIDWKFHQIDRNGDKFLVKAEYKTLRRHVTKLVRPRRCAKNFPRACDEDGDKRISATEWSICLGVELNSGLKYGNHLQNAPNQHRTSGRNLLKQGGPRKAEEEEGGGKDLEDEDKWDSPALQLQEASDSAESDQNESNDCYSERQSALEEVRHGAQGMYVPECSIEGKYQKVQCHKGTKYCWCANETDGRPIPNTSVHDRKPNCDALPLVQQVIPSRTHRTRPNNAGCAKKAPHRIQEEILEYFRENMISAFTNSGKSSSAALSASKEAVIKWQFATLDKDKNLVIDRSEMKEFRTLLKNSKKLKKCKRIASVCDSDEDKRVTWDELRICTGLIKGEVTPVPGPGGSHKRRGKNPLSTYLID
ncbi:SPARC-related modular calcium-binding protein 2-like isoform X2 [Artemia franciscana]|uniref:SPARC-related modular calcium-binding protein 1 n=1 Tax=Artemia franciscana TaxID=6661 RepID=A0AA88IW19_ARTSF|nr:hypothetical protein QYM36_008135 [Artemia franciscana]